MRVLVTGGAGYIGSCVVDELVKRDHEPVVLDNFLFGHESLRQFGNQVELIEGDCRNSGDLVYALKNVDFVIHLAGIVGEPACNINPLAHYTTNVESIRTLVNCMTDPEVSMVRDVLFASSCSVYGNVRGLYDEVTETTPINPLSAYAHSKVRAEKIIFDCADRNERFHPTVLRLTTLFGWSLRPRVDLVSNLFAYKAFTEGELTIFGSGDQYRSLVHVRDVAKAFVKVMEAPRLQRDRKIFHVGDEKNNRTVKEVAEIVKSILPETKINVQAGAATDRRDYKINCQLIRNLIDWEAEYSVEDGIKDIIDNLKAGDFTYDILTHTNNNTEYW